MEIRKQKEADFISLQNNNKIPLPIHNLYKLSINILQHNEYKINKGGC